MDKRSRAKFITAAAVALATFLVYLPALRNAFLNWDDDEYIYLNPFIRSLDTHLLKDAFTGFYAANWHPLTWLSHALDYALWGLDPVGHHLTNNVLHVLNAAIVVFVVTTLMAALRKPAKKGRSQPFFSDRMMLMTGAATGLLFGLHPLHVESVAWAAERKDLLCAFFFLLSIAAYGRYASATTVGSSGTLAPRFLSEWYLSALGLFLLSLMSKPMAVSLPIVLLILDWYPFGRIRSRGTFRTALVEKLPFFVLSALASVLTMLAQKAGGTVKSLAVVPLASRAVVAAKSLVAYLIKIVVPVHLVPFYPYPRNTALFGSADYVLSIVVLLAISAACWAVVKRQKVWMAAWSYYVITLMPTLGLVQVGPQSMADRYAYLPSLGPFLVLGFAAAAAYQKTTALKQRRVMATAAVLLLSITTLTSLCYATIRQIGIWKNSIVFWEYVLDREPEISLAHYNLGYAYVENGQLDKGAAEYRAAIRLQPNYAKAHFNLGLIYLRAGYKDLARAEFREGLSTEPNDARAQQILKDLGPP